MLVLDRVLCTRGRSSVAIPAVSGAWTGRLSRSEGACELSTTARALAVVRRRLSLALGEQGRQFFADTAAGENGKVRRRQRARAGAARESVWCGAVRCGAVRCVRGRSCRALPMELAQQERDERTGRGPRSLSQLALCGIVVSVCLHNAHQEMQQGRFFGPE
jgi:hypothetical protein